MIQDFIISAVFALLWLISASAWAQGVVDIKFYTDPDEIFHTVMRDECMHGQVTCKSTAGGNWAGLNVSLVCIFYPYYSTQANNPAVLIFTYLLSIIRYKVK